MRFRLYTLLLAVLHPAVHATVLRVPSDYPQIQLALDELQSGDTVLVDSGLYVEALVAPPLVFALFGNAAIDSTVEIDPVIDPSARFDANQVACLTLPSGSDAVISHVTFRNRSPMYNNRPANLPGGIILEAQNLALLHCEFDSVFAAVSGNGSVDLAHCEFVHSNYYCLHFAQGRVSANDCSFEGRCLSLVWAGSESLFEGCRFGPNPLGHLLWVTGNDVAIRNSVFGPSGSHAWAAIELTGPSNCRISSNSFTAIERDYGAIDLDMQCTGTDDPVEISENLFLNNVSHNGAIFVHCDGNGERRSLARIHHNLFENNLVLDPNGASALLASRRIQLDSNRFVNNNPDSIADILARRFSGTADTVFARGNIFEPNGIDADSRQMTFDARWNWWGDSSGPFHPGLNPNGDGGAVGDNVLFDPWLTDTTNSVHNERPLSTPESFSLECYPNPFNSEVTLSLFSTERAEIQVELFDLQGRLVREIWTGTVSGTKTLRFDANGLSSGIYFARARLTGVSHSVVSTKLILLK